MSLRLCDLLEMRKRAFFQGRTATVARLTAAIHRHIGRIGA